MRVVVLTSGGDGPGMNACVRAVARTGFTWGWEVFASSHGYNGLVQGRLEALSHNSVSNIIQRGGTVLGAGRCPELQTDEGLGRAVKTLQDYDIDGMVAIGGDGTFRGLQAIAQRWGGLCVGIPSTVDNDAPGSDYCIGFDTAVNTALDAIDRIRDTAEAYDRCFLIEVMGRGSGALAIAAGLAGGAEEVCVPETPTDCEGIARRLVAGKQAGRLSSIMVVAEGDRAGGAAGLAAKLEELSGLKFRVCILGHIQRGGPPTARDRVLASRLGAEAMRLLSEGKGGVVVGEIAGTLATTPLSKVGRALPGDTSDLALIELLAR